MNTSISSLFPFNDQVLNGVHTTRKAGPLPSQEFFEIQDRDRRTAPVVSACR